MGLLDFPEILTGTLEEQKERLNDVRQAVERIAAFTERRT
jgi:hypothetical protein